MSTWIKLEFELKTYAEDGDTLVRNVRFEASGNDDNRSIWSRLQNHGLAMSAAELAAFSKIVEGMNELREAIK